MQPSISSIINEFKKKSDMVEMHGCEKSNEIYDLIKFFSDVAF